MKPYAIEKIRNIAIVGHGGTGKSTLAEALLFVAGAIGRRGSIDEGTSASDFDQDEIARKMSISSSVLPVEWNGSKINIVDTPGYLDFVGEVAGALRAVEAALIIVDGSGNIEVGTESGWDNAGENGVSRLFFVNKLEKENTDFYSTLEALQNRFGNSVAPMQLPIGKDAGFNGVVDLLSQKAYKYDDGKASPIEAPADMVEQIADARKQLVEAVAEMDDELMMKYLDEDNLSDEDITKGVEIGLSSGKFNPVLCGSAGKLIGIDTLLNLIVSAVPSPASSEPVKGVNPAGVEEVRKPEDPFCALVFKTMADPYVGKLTYFKVFSGSLKSDSHVFNSSKGHEERVGQVYFLRGKTQEATPEVGPGDIGAVAKLTETITGDTLCEKSKPIVLQRIDFPASVYTLSVKAKTKSDEDKLGPALQKLTEEDPTFTTSRDPNTHETLISGMGDTHIHIVVDKLKRKFGVDVVTDSPKIAYREAITKTAEAQGRHKKQTGGRGQFGDCWVRLEPGERGSGYQFVDQIVGGSIPRQWIPSVDKGIREALNQGIHAGCQVVDVKAYCYDGSFHDVDSSDMAFQIAGRHAFRAAAEKAGPVILEPVMDLEVNVPEEYMGDVIGDLNGKRGRIAGMDAIGGGRQLIKSQVPQSEILRYCIDLRSIARGRGKFVATFSHYEEAPAHVAQQIIADAEKAKEE